MAQGNKHFIQKAIDKPGALRRQMGAKEGQQIPRKKLEQAAKGNSKKAKRARLALTLRRLNKNSRKAGR